MGAEPFSLEEIAKRTAEDLWYCNINSGIFRYKFTEQEAREILLRMREHFRSKPEYFMQETEQTEDRFLLTRVNFDMPLNPGERLLQTARAYFGQPHHILSDKRILSRVASAYASIASTKLEFARFYIIDSSSREAGKADSQEASSYEAAVGRLIIYPPAGTKLLVIQTGQFPDKNLEVMNAFYQSYTRVRPQTAATIK